MAVTIAQLMQAEVITRAISQIKTPMNRISEFYGFNAGGRNTSQVMGRRVGWDIFNHSRKVATISAPATGPRNVRKVPIGNVSSHTIRVHEKVHILYEQLVGNRAVGGRLGTVDMMGVRYVTKQERELAQRDKNARELAVVQCLKEGQLNVRIDGDDHKITRDAVDATFVVNFQHPAANRGAIAKPAGFMGGGNVFAGNWDVPGTATPHEELLTLNALSEYLSGHPIRHAWCTGNVWAQLLACDEVRELAGSSNMPFAQYDPVSGSMDGIRDTGFTGILRGIPHITWHVYEGVLDIDVAGTETTTKVLNDHQVIFTPEPDNAWMEVIEGGEFICENMMDSGRWVTGMGAWSTKSIDPAAFEIKLIDNFLPAPYIPNSYFVADVTTPL